MRSFTVIILLSAWLFSACGSESDSKPEDVTSDHKQQILFMDSLQVLKEHPNWGMDTASAFRFEYNYLLFAPGNGKVGERIDRVCYDLMSDHQHEGVLDSLAYQTSANDVLLPFFEKLTSSAQPRFRHSVEATMSLVVNKQNVLGIAIERKEEQGGQRATEKRLQVNFRISDGNIIRISDIIEEGEEEEFERIAERTFRKRYEIGAEVGWEHTPFQIFADGFRLNDNFLISETGLYYVFNPFDAALNEQFYDMIIAWKDIEHILKTESIVKRFISK